MQSFRNWLSISEADYAPHKGGEVAALHNILKQKVQTAASVPMTASGGSPSAGTFDAAKVGAEFKQDKAVKAIEKQAGVTMAPSAITRLALKMKQDWDRQQQTKQPGKEQ